MRRFDPRPFSESLRHRDDGPEIYAAFRAGRAVRLASGVYVHAEVWQQASPWVRRELCCAAITLARPGALFCGETAVMLHGLPTGPGHQELHLARTTKGHAGRQPSQYAARAGAVLLPMAPATVIHRHAWAAREQRAGHFATVPLDLAIAEVLGTRPVADGLVVADAALSAGFPEGIARQDLLAAAEGWPVGSQARRAARVLALADGRSESPGESLSRAILLQAGFEAPELQREFGDVEGFIGRVDFWWPRARVAGEFEGRDKWAGSLIDGEAHQFEVVRASHRRHERLTSHPEIRRVIRWGSQDLQGPSDLFERLERAGVARDPRRALRSA